MREELHHVPEVHGGRDQLEPHPGFSDLPDAPGTGHAARPIDEFAPAIRAGEAIGHRGRGEDELEAVLAAEPLTRHLQVQHA